MSSKRQSGQDDSNSLIDRVFYISPQPGSAALQRLITANGGRLSRKMEEKTIIIVEDETAHLNADESHTIYSVDLVAALIQDPNAINEEEYILSEGRTTAQSESFVGQKKYAMEEEVGEDVDKDVEEEKTDEESADSRVMSTEEEAERARQRWLSRSVEEYRSTYYSGNFVVEEAEHRGWELPFEVECPVPPPAVGTKIREDVTVVGTKFHDKCFAPPVALCDVFRAPDPPGRRYTHAENFAILIWYTVTIPYCGVESAARTYALHPRRRRPTFNKAPPYAAFRWNWARTHGICLRTLDSIIDRWKFYVIKYFIGESELPAGNFRARAALSGLYWFADNRIVGFRISAIKRLNNDCRLLQDAPEDPYCMVDQADVAYDNALKAYLEREYGDRLHNGRLFEEFEQDEETFRLAKM